MRTKIEWVRNFDGTQGYTINPVKGLCPVACPYCYARRMYKRFKWNPEIRFDPIVLADPFCYPKPSTIFVGSTIELFGDWIKPAWTEMILEFCQRETNKRHTYIFLTKQPQDLPREFPENCWVGVTATNEHFAAVGLGNLKSVDAKVKFLSIEPLLHWLDANFWARWFKDINWLIIGQQTPVSAKTEPKIEYIREIVEAADKAGIPVFLKENLVPLIAGKGTPEGLFYEDCRLRQEMPK